MVRQVMMGWMCVWGCLGWADAAVYYVDDGATGANSGSSWADACVTLQLALDRAGTGDEIRVAGGVYRPAGHGGDRAASFSLDVAVNILGGYAGCGAADPDARNVTEYPTVLSGDLNGDDVAVDDLTNLCTEPTRNDNSYHVIRVRPYDGQAVIDGCTISGGNAAGAAYVDMDGGGLLDDYYSGGLRLSYCVIENNSAVYQGGGVSFRGDMDHCLVRNNCGGYGGGMSVSGRISNCIVEGNASTNEGGGIAVQGQPHIVDCVLRNNSALRGGGLSTVYDDALIERCLVTGNHAETDGGGVYSYNCDTCQGYPRFYQCLFTDNSAGEKGGAVYEGGITEIWLVNCTVFGNTAGQTGGVHILPSNGRWWLVGNCVIWGNEDTAGMGTLAAQICPTAVTETETGGFTYCCIEGWSGATGIAGKGSIGGDPRFVDAAGLNLRLLAGSPCIDAGNDGFYPAATTDPPAGTGGGHVPGAADMDGNCRFAGRSVDIGAYEFGALTRCATTWYVQADANSLAADGTSWQTALAFLQDAMMLAVEGDEIRVAQGTYRPGDFALSDRPGLGREETFALASGVTIKGGYAGLGEPDPDARDVRRYETILSGDLAGTLPALTRENYEYMLMTRGREEYTNCYHVVSAIGVDGTAVLDGVTITGGTANGPAYGEPTEPRYVHGGGVYVDGADPTLIDCTITGNIAFVYGGPAAQGGGMYCKSSRPKLVRCRFVFNWADDYDSDAFGAGMMNEDSSPVLVDCVFENNGTWNWGGAMANVGASGVTLTGCTFAGNWGQYGGGAIWNAVGEGHVLTARNCLFAGNSSGQPGGAVHLAGWRGLFENCTFAENRVRDDAEGRAVGGEEGFKAVNCIFRDGGGEFSTPSADITFSNVEEGWDDEGNIAVDPLFARSGRWVAPATTGISHYNWTPGDYHLQSRAGRWDPAEREWVLDSRTSPCIDAGDPRTSIMYEPFPNGGVVNMGAYGGTAEASKTYFEGVVCDVVTVGDLNGDCVVNLADLALMAGHWMERR